MKKFTILIKESVYLIKQSLVDLVLGTGEWMLMAGETYFDEHTVALSCLNIFSSNSMS